MDRFRGIRRAETKLARNDYRGKKRAKRNTGGILARYIAALLVVGAVAISTTLTDFCTELFKQDYNVRYAQD